MPRLLKRMREEWAIFLHSETKRVLITIYAATGQEFVNKAFELRNWSAPGTYPSALFKTLKRNE